MRLCSPANRTPPMNTSKIAALALLFAVAVLSLAGLPHRPAARRIAHRRVPAAADPAILSQVARAQAAALLAQHPNAAVGALVGF
jgi:hypothetical protein